MKKNKNLSRAWFWSYVVLIFGAALAPLLAVKFSMALSIVFIVFAVITLGLIIAARVLYTKNRPLFPFFALSAQGLNSLLVLIAMIMEIILTAQGQPAVYAWIIGSIGVLLLIFIDYQTIMVSKKIFKGEKIIEGKQ